MTTFWDNFIPQVLASLAGAAVGFLAVLVAFRLQRRSAYADTLQSDVIGLLVALASYASELQHHVDTRQWGFSPLPGAPKVAPKPTPFAVSIRIEIVSMRARGHDREIAEILSKTWFKILKTADLKLLVDGVGYFAGAVSAWQAGLGDDEVRSRLEDARLVSDGGIVVEPDDEK